MFAMLLRGFGIHSTVLLHFPWSIVAVTEHAWSSSNFVHSKYSTPWLPTYPALVAPAFLACVWRAGKNQPHHCCISVHAHCPAPIHFLRTGISKEYEQLFKVPGDKTCTLPRLGFSYGTSCPSLVDSLSMPSTKMFAPLEVSWAFKFFPM